MSINKEQVQRALREKNWDEVRAILERAISVELTSAERGALIVVLTEAVLEALSRMNNAQADMLQEVINAVSALEEGKKEVVDALGKDWVDQKIKGLQEKA